MKNLFNIILLITLCIGLTPVFADDNDELNDDETIGLKREASVKEINTDDKARKASKKKKGERNVKVQPSKEDDENIILELDRT